jgi:sigma-E factor negative regulatory protein RseA
MNEELDSQLSAMFDDALPSQECELLARRLSRDELLKARWGRYAVIGAAIRAERGVRLNAAIAGRVTAAILTEPELGASATPQRRRRAGLAWWQGGAAAAVAASVATLSIIWLRSQSPQPLVTALAQPVNPPAGAITRVANTSATADSYVTPRAPAVRAMLVPTTELANYVVAHSMVSSPMARRNMLSAFMTSDPNSAGMDEPQDDVKANAR